jgi:cell division GTPase FtsZ
MSDDPAHDEIAAVIRATTSLVTNEPNLIGFDFADLREAFKNGGTAVFGQGEAAAGPDRATRAAEAAIADLKRKLSQSRGTP